MKKLYLLFIILLLCSCGAANEAEIIPSPSVIPSSSPVQVSSPAPDVTPEITAAVPSHSPEIKETAQAQEVPESPQPEPPRTDTVRISATGPADMTIIIPESEIDIAPGDTVFDLLLKAAAAHGVTVEYTGSKSSAYIKGVGGLHEFDRGPASGWLYTVNGEHPAKSCGALAAKDGDVIEFLYKIE